MGDRVLEEWFYEVPLVTRSYVTAVFLTTLACQLDIVSAYHLYFNWGLVVAKGQYWRLFSSFLYFGGFSIDFMFHMFFLVRYSRMLEEGSFRGRTADYFWMLVLGAASIITIAALFVERMPFLSSPLTFLLVYVWSRRNPHVRMNFLGVFNFNAPYLPWVLLAFTFLLNNVTPVGDLVGMAVGHVYYFLEDVYPRLPADPHLQEQRQHVLGAPRAVKRLFGELVRDENDPTLVEETVDAAQVGGANADPPQAAAPPAVADTVDYGELIEEDAPAAGATATPSQDGLRRRQGGGTGEPAAAAAE